MQPDKTWPMMYVLHRKDKVFRSWSSIVLLFVPNYFEENAILMRYVVNSGVRIETLLMVNLKVLTQNNILNSKHIAFGLMRLNHKMIGIDVLSTLNV